MRVLKTTILLAMLAAAPAHAQGSRADAVIGKAIAAMGGIEKIRARTSLVLRGMHYEGAYHQEFATGGSGNALMTRMRPNLRVVGCVPALPGCDGKFGRIVEGYDGSDGWELNGPRQRLVHAVNKARSALICGAQFDPLFVDYRKRGFSAAYLGRQTLLGIKTEAVRIDHPGCPSETFYFDARTYRLRMQRVSLPVHARGDAVDTVRVLSDLRPVAGVLMPFRSEEIAIADGHVLFGEIWASIEANTIADPAIFTAPEVHPSGSTALALAMLAAAPGKSSAELLAMYDAFRATAEGAAADTAYDMNWLGYELLKVDNYPAALAIFTRVIAEHPDSANAYDSLGDAYLQQGDIAAALAAFDKAISLDPTLRETVRKRDALKRS
ncbi:MAG: tetratricopeptide repeat protein [Sphingomonas sp.]|uniref:tetratricopeptide repeat protein n=1 Tax=Sphingomonas sp. TaxID=28214 RepID=UPI0025D841D5|nr:tetratricopeptide repeat protein [Sphingomonas sp.]MBX3563740.1 tetratricopeptide repeat protein [Sphingomonas sp.]